MLSIAELAAIARIPPTLDSTLSKGAAGNEQRRRQEID